MGSAEETQDLNDGGDVGDGGYGNQHDNDEDDSSDGGVSISSCELKARTWQANFSSTLHCVTLCDSVMCSTL